MFRSTPPSTGIAERISHGCGLFFGLHLHRALELCNRLWSLPEQRRNGNGGRFVRSPCFSWYAVRQVLSLVPCAVTPGHNRWGSGGDATPCEDQGRNVDSIFLTSAIKFCCNVASTCRASRAEEGKVPGTAGARSDRLRVKGAVAESSTCHDAREVATWHEKMPTPRREKRADTPRRATDPQNRRGANPRTGKAPYFLTSTSPVTCRKSVRGL